jgi:serine/threonine-protein kinase RsbT
MGMFSKSKKLITVVRELRRQNEDLSRRNASAGLREAVSKTEFQVKVGSDVDIVLARQKGRDLAENLGFSALDLTLIATAISELARNILQYGQNGEILVGTIHHRGRRGVFVIARDEGPGIPDLRRAMEAGFSTSGGLGLGLKGVKRFMDNFEIRSEIGRGTTVKVKKWIR